MLTDCTIEIERVISAPPEVVTTPTETEQEMEVTL